MEKSKKSINEEGGFLFCGGWNFSKSVSVGSTFIRDMRVRLYTIMFGRMGMEISCDANCYKSWNLLN